MEKLVQPGTVVKSPFLEGFKSHVGVALGDVVRDGTGSAGEWLDALGGLFQPSQLCDSTCKEYKELLPRNCCQEKNSSLGLVGEQI